MSIEKYFKPRDTLPVLKGFLLCCVPLGTSLASNEDQKAMASGHMMMLRKLEDLIMLPKMLDKHDVLKCTNLVHIPPLFKHNQVTCIE